MYALIAAGLLASAAPAEPPGGAAGQLKTAKETYAQAQQVYHDSCETRAYAAYDDICDQLGKQLHDYAVEIDKLTRKAEDEKLRSGSRP